MCVCVCVCTCVCVYVRTYVRVNVHRKMTLVTLGFRPNCESNPNCIIIGIISFVCLMNIIICI